MLSQRERNYEDFTQHRTLTLNIQCQYILMYRYVNKIFNHFDKTTFFPKNVSWFTQKSINF